MTELQQKFIKLLATESENVSFEIILKDIVSLFEIKNKTDYSEEIKRILNK